MKRSTEQTEIQPRRRGNGAWHAVWRKRERTCISQSGFVLPLHFSSFCGKLNHTSALLAEREETGRWSRLFTQCLPRLVHSSAEDALRHKRLCVGETLLVDIAFKHLGGAVCGVGTGSPLCQMCGHHRVALSQQRPTALDERGDSTGERADLFGLRLPGGRQQVSRIAVPPCCLRGWSWYLRRLLSSNIG